MGLLDNPQDAALLKMGLGLLSAGGPSRMPVSLGQAIGSAGNSAMDEYRQTEQNNQMKQMREMQMQQQRAQAEEAARRQAAIKTFRDQLPTQLQAQFDADPQTFIKHLYDKQREQAMPWYVRKNPDGTTSLDPTYSEFEKAKAREARPPTPFYQFLPTADGYAVGNARSGQIAPAMVGGKPIVKASDDPALQGRIAEAKESGKTLGEERTKAALDAPRVIDNAETAIRHVDELLSHPGFSTAVGKSSMLGVQKVPGTDAYDFMNRLDQIKGGAFLEAFNSLKGGGQITEVEGKKATDAIARMNNATSEREFKNAAEDFKSVIRVGVNRAKMKAKPVSTPTQAQSTGGVKFLGFE